jgi:ABC-type sugar transport system permease subunit
MSNRADSSIRRNGKAYALIALPLFMILLFSYYPFVNGLIHIFYRWDGSMVEEYIGLDNIRRMFRDHDLWRTFLVLSVFVLANIIKMIPSLIAAVVLHHVISTRWQYVYRICFIIPMIVPVAVGILMWKYFYEPNQGAINMFLRAVHLLGVTDNIAWLTETSLVIPSLVFVGFPWVGAFGVLVFLAGLQNISMDLYEAARVDGAGPIRVFFNIELPLIMSQIRINLLLVFVGTIQGWEYIYLFLGEGGGPGGIATVPGLYIFREAFRQGYFGYGCAIGLLLFVLTLGLTIVNNRYVRVEK